MISRLTLCLMFSITMSWVCADDFTDRTLPLIETHCLDCHDGETKKGGVDLERFEALTDVFDDREIWASVYHKVESHQMPPPKRKTLPTNEERKALLTWIEQMAAMDDPQLGAPDPGKPVLRRLHRLEYNNTVRDLLGLDVDSNLSVRVFPMSNLHFNYVLSKWTDV